MLKFRQPYLQEIQIKNKKVIFISRPYAVINFPTIFIMRVFCYRMQNTQKKENKN